MSRVPRAERPPLTRARIVAGALELVDAEGLDALTMRRLADHLGVGAMSLYRHVRDREDLLDLIVEGILDGVDLPAPGGTWRADIEAIARAMRRGLLRHRSAAVLVTTRLGLGRGGLAAMDRTIGVLRSGGFGDADAVAADRALGNLIAGACLFEAAGLGQTDGADREARRAEGRALVSALPAEAYPDLVAVADAVFDLGPDEAFEAGLAALLDGFELRLLPRQD